MVLWFDDRRVNFLTNPVARIVPQPAMQRCIFSSAKLTFVFSEGKAFGSFLMPSRPYPQLV
jgi:hypothetical protein